MLCPKLSELPPPPAGKSGWPWTEESDSPQIFAHDATSRPRISVITPSFNQGHFIEETIRSVLLQGYPELEYFIYDAGSTDNSVEIIQKYSQWITGWVSEPDGGQSDAINRGLRRATGQLATWINSDDLLCKNAINEHVSRYGCSDNTVYIGICTYIDAFGSVLSEHQGRVHCLEDLVRVGDVWRSHPDRGHIVQPEVLFPRQLALSVGGLSPDNHRTMDYELWGKLLLAGAKFAYTDVRFARFREHPAQKTQNVVEQNRSLLETAAKLVTQSDTFSEETKAAILTDLRAYGAAWEAQHWSNTGRLAKFPLPRGWVRWLRDLRGVADKHC